MILNTLKKRCPDFAADLEQFRCDLIREHGKFNESFWAGGQLLAYKEEVNSILFPRGSTVIADGKLHKVEGPLDFTTVEPAIGGIVEVESITREGFNTKCGIFIKTDRLEGALVWMAQNTKVDVYRVNGEWVLPC